VISPGAGARLAPLTLLPAPDAPGAVGGLYATRAGFVRALDDRGEAALACVREVHGQGWTLVLKVDEDEALAPLHRELATRALITALLITALTALAFALVWGQRRAHGAALARHRERLAILLDEANDPVADLTPEGVFVQVNRRAEEFYGVPGGLVARNAFDSIVVPGAGPGFAEITRVLASHGRYTFPSEHLAAGGVRVPVEVSVRAVPIDGEAHWVAVVRDLRDRRRAEARIERLNRLLRATTAVVMAIHHEDDEQALFAKACRLSSGIGGFLLASVAMGHPDRAVEFAYMACRPPLEPGAIPITTNAATRNRGTSAMAIRTGRSVLIRDLDDERLDADVRESFERAGARSGGSSPIRVHGEVRGAFTLFSEDADAFDEEAMGLIESTAAELGHALGAIEDRRTRARVEERLGAMFAAGPAGFVVADDRGVVTHANAEFLRIVGRTREELDAGRIPAGALGAANGGGSDPAEPAPFETELERPDGARVPVLMGRMRLSRGAGETLAVVLDMTRLHETAASLRQTQMQLLQAQKMETIGQLAGGVAHDFNNLLTVIHGYAELLRSHHDASDADAAALDQIMRAADRATTLTRQLLAFSRRQVLEPRIVDLRTLLHDAAEMLRRIIGNAVRLEITCDEALGPVLADPSQLEQVLVNLVVNARDAMPDGGRIRIEAGDAEVDAAWAAAHPPIPAGMFVRFAVSDEGSGIAPDVLPHIFEPFFTTKAVGKGTGLGLATVYGIVKQSGGFVFVSSQPGAGASFEVLLPRV
jgi:PAS domain S-box-containing protein